MKQSCVLSIRVVPEVPARYIYKTALLTTLLYKSSICIYIICIYELLLHLMYYYCVFHYYIILSCTIGRRPKCTVQLI